jgi:PGF-pre-PGF domain-containing protein
MREVCRQYRSLLAACVVACLLIGTAGAGVVIAETYDLTVSDAVETPSETVDFEGSTYELDAFAVREPGESLDVAVTAPDGTDFRVDLYNSDKAVEMFRSGQGSESVTFDADGTEDLEPGTYSLVLNAESNNQALHPVVISGYDLSVSLPEEADVGETIEIDVSVTPTELSGDPSAVEVVFWNDDRVERVDATKSDGTYSASIDLSEFDTGAYNVHAAAQGDEEFRGEKEILGLSDQQTIDVVDSSDDADNSGDGDDGAPAGGGGGGGAPLGGGQPAQNDTTTEEPETNTSDGDNGNETDAISEITETTDLVDENPDSPGIQVSFKNTTIRALKLSNETATGNVTVTDRSSPPPNASEPTGSAVATVEITVPETERNTPATIEFAVPATSVTDTDQLTVERYNDDNDSWTPLATTVTETNETTVTVVAETPGFSVFAVTEMSSESTESTSDENETDENETNENDSDTSDSTSTSDSSDNTDDVITPSESENQQNQPEEQPGFGIFLVVIALLLAVGRRAIQM